MAIRHHSKSFILILCLFFLELPTAVGKRSLIKGESLRRRILKDGGAVGGNPESNNRLDKAKGGSEPSTSGDVADPISIEEEDPPEAEDLEEEYKEEEYKEEEKDSGKRDDKEDDKEAHAQKEHSFDESQEHSSEDEAVKESAYRPKASKKRKKGKKARDKTKNKGNKLMMVDSEYDESRDKLSIPENSEDLAPPKLIAPEDSPDEPTDPPAMKPSDEPTDPPGTPPAEPAEGTDTPIIEATEPTEVIETDPPTSPPASPPTNAPTSSPTDSPTSTPTSDPTLAPSEAPTDPPETDPPATDPPVDETSAPETEPPTVAPTEPPIAETDAPETGPPAEITDAPVEVTDAPEEPDVPEVETDAPATDPPLVEETDPNIAVDTDAPTTPPTTSAPITSPPALPPTDAPVATPSPTMSPTGPTCPTAVQFTGTMEYNFVFADREPTDEEVESVEDATLDFFVDLFREEFGDSVVEISGGIVDSEFDFGPPPVFEMTIEAVVPFSGCAPPIEEVNDLLELSDAQYDEYLTEYIFPIEPSGQHIFVLAARVSFDGSASYVGDDAPTSTEKKAAKGGTKGRT